MLKIICLYSSPVMWFTLWLVLLFIFGAILKRMFPKIKDHIYFGTVGVITAMLIISVVITYSQLLFSE
jgi:hypothetical protein